MIARVMLSKYASVPVLERPELKLRPFQQLRAQCMFASILVPLVGFGSFSCRHALLWTYLHRTNEEK